MFGEAMKVLKWIAAFVRFINRNPLIAREIEHCNQNIRENERFASRERRMTPR